MPMQGAIDTLGAKPKFPKERTEHGTIVLVATAPTVNAAGIASYKGNSTINFVSVTGLANGMIVQGWSNANNAYQTSGNIGNNTPVVSGGSGILGFDQVGPTVSNIQGTLVTISSAIVANVANGQLVYFSKPFLYKPNTYANTYNANTYFVTSSRVKNANSLLYSSKTGVSGTHQGWNYVKVGTGFVKAVSGGGVNTQINTYGAGYLPGSSYQYVIFTANSQYGDTGTGANVAITVNANGNVSGGIVNSGGSNYILTPGALIAGINTSTIAANAVAYRYISSVTFTGTWGTGYSNGFATFSGGNGGGANVGVTVNTAGSIITTQVFFTGGGWGTTAPTITPPGAGSGATLTPVMANGANATLFVTMGGRANRITTEVLSVIANSAIVASDPSSGGLWFPGS